MLNFPETKPEKDGVCGHGTSDSKNNNASGEEHSKHNVDQQCTQCSTASLSSSSGTNSSRSSSNGVSTTLDCVTTMIDDPQSNTVDWESSNTEEIEAIYANARKLQSFSSTNQHRSAIVESQKCLSPVAEDLNSSGKVLLW